MVSSSATVISTVVPNVRKIAILRANALGDLIFALPALDALRAAYPQAERVLLARQWHQQFFAQRPSPIDRVIEIPLGGIGQEGPTPQNPIELAAFFNQMQQENFDVAIQLHGGGRNSNPFVLQLGARLTVGLRTPDAPLLDRWVPYIYYQPEVLRYLEVVSLLGATPTSVEPKITVTETDRLESYAVVPDDRQPLVVLHPGASDPRRCWSVEQFAAVGDELAATGVHVLVTGTQRESDRAQAVIARMQAPAQNLCGALSLNGLTGLLARCQLVISNDSGPLHLAAAVGTPTVGIYWCGNLITAAPLTRRVHRPAISWRLHCPICGVDCTRDRCDHSASFVEEVTTQEVIASALELLTLR